MAPLRRLLARLTAVWLLSQVGAATFVPVAVSLAMLNPHEEECTCGTGEGAMCPMHHRPSRRPGDCVMRAADTSDVAILTTIAPGADTASRSTGVVDLPTERNAVGIADARVSGEHPVPPEPPPPRA